MNEGSTDTGELKRELAQTRSRLDSTIGVLQQKLAPGTMVDQAVEYFTEGGGVELGRNLGRSMRDLCTCLMKCCSMASVIEKLAITPSFIGRTVAILPGVRPSIFLASLPTAATARGPPGPRS